MSGRSGTHHNSGSNARPWLGAGLVTACALLVGLIPGAAAQQPDGAENLDDRRPLPPKEPKRPSVVAKFRFPGAQSPLYSTIEDNQPVRSEKENPGEFAAWNDLILWAKQFPAADLEAVAGRDFTPEDLTHGIRTGYRFDPFRFDGKLTEVRRVRPTKALDAAGVKELYEGWLQPVDEPPANAVCVVFTELPADLPKPPEIAAGKDAGEPVDVDKWATFAGYSFKLLGYPGPDADPKNPKAGGWQKAPLLIGRTITLLGGPPPEATSIALNKNLRIFKLIQDDTRITADPNVWEEEAAWNRVVLHARKFTPEQLEEAARRDLSFASLFEAGRQDYKLELVYFEGRLIRLSKGENSKRLADAGVPTWYEGWLVPKDEPRGNPICVVMTDLPAGLVPKPLMTEWVSFAGYSFKLMHYKSGETDKKDASRNVTKRAPLLIGRSVIVHEDRSDDGPTTWSATMLPLIVGGLLLLIAIGVGLSWWFRRGDRQVRAETDAARFQNPFGA